MEKRDNKLLQTYKIILFEYQKFRKLRILCMRIYDTFYPEHLEERITEELLPCLEQFDYPRAKLILKSIELDKANWLIKEKVQ